MHDKDVSATVIITKISSTWENFRKAADTGCVCGLWCHDKSVVIHHLCLIMCVHDRQWTRISFEYR